ncbi:MAG: DUF58 domain-containing protein [Candidatus Ancillula sp.]|jgi:hypothetical protein|nr:DUF58 domain-containing protein [Candidatus Ancillula sp.]
MLKQDKFKNAWKIILPPGRFCLLLIVASLILSLNLGWQSFSIIFFTALFIFLFALLFIIGSSDFEVSFSVANLRVVVGEKALGKLIVKNTGTRPSFWTTIEVKVGEQYYSYSIPPLLQNREYKRDIILPSDKRQVVDIGPASLVKTDPLRMVRIEKDFGGKVKFFVHPQTVQVPSTEVGRIKDLEGEASRILTQSDIPFQTLREYVPGDPIKNIHWKTTAKYGTLMVKQFEETRRSKIAIVLSVNPDDYSSNDEFETAISAIASLGVQALYDKREVEIYTTEQKNSGGSNKKLSAKRVQVKKIGTKIPRQLLDELTAVKLTTDSVTIVEACENIAENSDATFVIIGCGSILDVKMVEKASAHLPVGVVTSAVRVEVGVKPNVITRSSGNSAFSIVTIAEPQDIREFVLRKVL